MPIKTIYSYTRTTPLRPDVTRTYYRVSRFERTGAQTTCIVGPLRKQGSAISAAAINLIDCLHNPSDGSRPIR